MDIEVLCGVRSRILSHRAAAFVIAAILHAVLIVTAWSIAKDYPGTMDVFEVSLVERPSAGPQEAGLPARLPDIQQPSQAMSVPPPAIRSEQPARFEIPEKKPLPETVPVNSEKVESPPAESAEPAREAVSTLPDGVTREGTPDGTGRETEGGEPSDGQGSGKGKGGKNAGAGTDKFSLQAYQIAVRAKIEAAKVYPLAARWRHIEGTVLIAFHLSNRGKLLQADIIKSSGSALLDDAAMAAVRRGAPFPNFYSEENEVPPRMTIDLKFVLE
ncbi:TonB family protein [bacterium]|nr:TonB family protein [bacterium]